MLRATVLALLVSLSACVAPFNLEINSIPQGAEVYLVSPSTGRENFIGKTPLRKRTELRGPFTLVVRLAGFVPYEDAIQIEKSTQLKRVVELDVAGQ